ncbi:hypothetical protein NPIL_224181 [Nephila pilipes]|uniref:Uncharacterized protein n=1 Tax=Nephila pilipes TaxID=299642 RepID=A0A8X6TJ31_NEPPI|nr:hypothetical protein NPIL_224181 [Nephila pilipes]
MVLKLGTTAPWDTTPVCLRHLSSTKKYFHLDEITNIDGITVLMFVMFPFKMRIEEPNMSDEFETYSTGDEIFKVIDKCVQKNDLEWNKCMDISAVERM